MKRKIISGLSALILPVLFAAPAARADIVEVRGKGMLNGKILSQDDAQMQFKDASGEKHVFAKKDVLFVEIEKDPTLGEKLKKAADGIFVEKKKKPAPAAAAKPAASASAPSAAGTGTAGLMSMAFEQMAQAQSMAAMQQARMSRAMAEAEGGGGGGGSDGRGSTGDYEYSSSDSYYRKSVLDKEGGFVSLKDE